MAITSKKVKKQENLCTICMTRSINCKTIQCSHQFCYRCLSKWGRRKGNCPMCRQNIRKIQYKKKVIEPEFLKIFDEEKFQSEQEINFNNPSIIYYPWYYFQSNYLQIPTIAQLENNNVMKNNSFFTPYFLQ